MVHENNAVLNETKKYPDFTGLIFHYALVPLSTYRTIVIPTNYVYTCSNYASLNISAISYDT